GRGARREDRLDGLEVRILEPHLERTSILLEIAYPSGARDQHDVRALRQHPGERQLRRTAVFLPRQRLHLFDESEVAGEVLALEARLGAPVVIGGEVVGTL